MVQYGESAPTPEEELIVGEDCSLVRDAIDELGPGLREVATFLLEYLEDHDGLGDQAAVLAFLAASTGRNVSWRDVTTVLSSLARECSQVSE